MERAVARPYIDALSGVWHVCAMMHRTQITLDPELQRRATRKAQAQGISFSEYLRRLLARDLDEPSAETPPSVVFDLGESRDSDIARRKEAMVGEAVVARRTHSRG
ncbi:MAG TPA: hypothetical protein VE175_13360 [Woeseiaceae bacterium]|nr:hypothetical protein [Woeseiaceae bacterium]